MNSKTKRRAIAVTGVIIIVLVVVLAVVGSQGSARTVSVAQAASGEAGNAKIQVSGNVVQDSFSVNDNVLTFAIYDPDGDQSQQLRVSYDGGVSATFGNDVTAICTGKIGDDGVLNCTELVTKCPSKYENRTDALPVGQLLGYGDDIYGKTLKVQGTVAQGSLRPAGEGDRFVLADPDTGEELPILFDGALPDGVEEGSTVVVTGDLTEAKAFDATDVAIASE